MSCPTEGALEPFRLEPGFKAHWIVKVQLNYQGAIISLSTFEHEPVHLRSSHKGNCRFRKSEFDCHLGFCFVKQESNQTWNQPILNNWNGFSVQYCLRQRICFTFSTTSIPYLTQYKATLARKTILHLQLALKYSLLPIDHTVCFLPWSQLLILIRLGKQSWGYELCSIYHTATDYRIRNCTSSQPTAWTHLY